MDLCVHTLFFSKTLGNIYKKYSNIQMKAPFRVIIVMYNVTALHLLENTGKC